MRLRVSFGALALSCWPLLAGSVSVAEFAEAARRPNFLILMADDCTYNDLPVYGGRNATTPNLDALAKRGLTFNQAYVASAMCQPCRAELFTGQYPMSNGCAWNHSASRGGTKSLPHMLRPLGYRVGIAGKVHVRPPAAFPFDRVDGFDPNCVRDPTRDHDLASVRDYLSDRHKSPFCLVIALVEPHVPWVMGDASRYPPRKIDLPPNLADTPLTREHFADYLAEVTYMDGQVGEILAALEASGSAEETLILFTSEQGSQFPGCKWTNWNAGVHTALIAYWPGRIPQGRRTDALVQYADVAPTLLELAGGNSAPAFDGTSFAAVLRGESDGRREFAFGMHNNLPEGPRYPIRSITDGRYRYLRNLLPEEIYVERHLMGGGRLNNPYWASWLGADPLQSPAVYEKAKRYLRRPAEELYLTVDDPYELTNLASDAEHAEVKAKLAAALDGWMQSEGDPGAAVDTLEAPPRRPPARPPRVRVRKRTSLRIINKPFHAVSFFMPTRPLQALPTAAALGLLLTLGAAARGDVAIWVDTPMAPPGWAVLQRRLLEANSQACEEFFQKYFDERGWLLCVERWGGDDGPDDAIENCNDWPVLHALGGDESVRRMVRQAWEGHLRQYTLAKTEAVPFARDGMYYKEFPTMFDWQHNGEGLTVFWLLGLSDPNDPRHILRTRRYAGFYMGEDPGAPNWDARHKIIRSMINGSRGPMLRKATALDWTGDPIEVENRFILGHGERNYEEMLAHFEDYNDVAGDHPLNLLTTTLALNAYLLTGEEKYRRWLLEYVDAWAERMESNGGIIPSNIGLNGEIGGETDGKWYGGTYGWAFSVIVPQTGEIAHRNRHHAAITGFANALLLTGDQRYIDLWRRQRETINSHGKRIDGRMMYPHMHGDDGWYDFTPQKYNERAVDIWYWSMREDDRRMAPDEGGWLSWLAGEDPDWPERSLRRDFAAIRQKVAGMRADTTTPDTRLADDPMKYNPCTVDNLIRQTTGGIPIRKMGTPLHCRMRHFDPVLRRAGLPPDVGVLVEKLTETEMTLTLVNVSPLSSRVVTLQAGAYGEHQFVSLKADRNTARIDGPTFTVRLAPGCGTRMTLQMECYVNRPTLAHPWNRKWIE